ncbi:unnamed protein product [Dimorphilus gyrociliatus]|uniref:CMP/dCMP-type deaminase domain-containing protein n=1 Tax=Dimorphilus gyrociliatus TaxID=2664684 RepID=A0A7I8VLN9_9ANNE|nr:unnamed protein product [Dimorphilus gyrociliatus]
MSEIDWMNEAFTVAKLALENFEVPVGCVIVFDNKCIATGSNEVNETKNATRHAEMIAIDKVIKFSQENNLDSEMVLKNSELYVTVEPCIMCASALKLVGLKKITYGCNNDRFGGCESVFSVCSSDQEVIGGVRAEEAINLLKQFYKRENVNAPDDKRKLRKD